MFRLHTNVICIYTSVLHYEVDRLQNSETIETVTKKGDYTIRKNKVVLLECQS